MLKEFRQRNRHTEHKERTIYVNVDRIVKVEPGSQKVQLVLDLPAKNGGLQVVEVRNTMEEVMEKCNYDPNLFVSCHCSGE